MIIDAAGSVNNITKSAGGQTLGKEDFMNLLLKQLSYQDPLNPMDSTEFTSQLTQFTSLEELNNINSTLSDVLAFQQSMQNATVTNMIGKNVRAPGNTTYLKEKADISYELSGESSSVKISIFDGSGKVVWSKDVGYQAAGSQVYIWDGMDNEGNQMPEGRYTVEIEAEDGSGNPVQALTSASGTVTGVFFRDNTTYLVLEDGRNIHLGEIQSIGDL